MQLVEPHAPVPQRILSLDAYRGLIMLLLAGSDCFLNLHLPDRPFYNAIAFQFEHHPWGAISFYDLIMPAFLLMVGVAMSFSIGRRLGEGAKKSALLIDLLRRALVLLLLSEIITSVEQRHLDLQLHNILAHIAIISVLCFFLMQLPAWAQALIAILILALHSALYLGFPGADGAFQPITNFGAVLDRFLMGHN
jgi:predicted acyltransferase